MKYRIDLSNYQYETTQFQVVDEKRVEVPIMVTVKVQEELPLILRLEGVYKGGVDTCDGVELARKIKETTETFVDVEPKTLELVKGVLDVLIKPRTNAQGLTVSLGGERYIPLIQRVFKPIEVV